MEMYENEPEKLDLLILLEDFLAQAKRWLILGLALTALSAAGMCLRGYRSYTPRYEAYAAFTVRVANPLYASVSSYNAKTAEVMASTFPSILTSGILQSRVMEELGLSSVPALRVSAAAEANIFTLTVSDSDPGRAYSVLNAVITHYPDIAEFVIGSTVLILLDESGVPTEPANRLDLKGLAVKGGLLGAAVWAGMILLRILIKNTVHNEEELKKTVNIPCLGQVPAVKRPGQAGCPLIHRSRRRDGFPDSIRLLRLHVEKAMADGGGKILLVSGAVPGEGTTTVAVNLAVSMAQKGRRVLLMDWDLRSPSLVSSLGSKACPLTDENSLGDYLLGRAALHDVIQPTDAENLFLISGGKGNLLYPSGQRLAALSREVRTMFDLVILDTPPCSLPADPWEASALADCALMVIRQDHASRDQILEGLQRLSESGLNVIGCVLNGVRRGLAGYGCGYGYGYGYGYGGRNMN